MSAPDRDVTLATIVFRTTGKSVSQMSAAEADMTLTMARDVLTIAASFAGEHIASAIEAAAKCSCTDSYCAQRATAKRDARIARTEAAA